MKFTRKTYNIYNKKFEISKINILKYIFLVEIKCFRYAIKFKLYLIIKKFFYLYITYILLMNMKYILFKIFYNIKKFLKY